MPMHELDIMNMCMETFSSSSTSTTMQNFVTGSSQFDPFPVLDNRYDMTGAAGLFNMQPTGLAQVGAGEIGFYGEYGILEANNMGLERDLSLPPLESRSNIEENNIAQPVDMKSNNNNHFNNGCFNNTDHSFKVENMFGFGNHAQGESLKMGEWDFEGLMQDLSSFPFLDFHVE
jgi:myb proto-oncogene protein